MDCMGCECTEKSMKKLETAIDDLLKKGRKVNKIMDNEKGNIQMMKEQEVADLRSYSKAVDAPSEYSYFPTVAKFIPPEIPPNPTQKRRTIHNKLTGEEESIDFDIPSLRNECSIKSTASSKSSSKSCKRQKQQKNNLITATLVTSVSDGFQKKGKNTKICKDEFILRDSYLVDRDGKPQREPSLISAKQLPNGSIDIKYKFFDENGAEMMFITFNLKHNEVRNVRVDNKAVEAQM